uniref:non-specific serine/threonine protein kinase n=1 Tax=Onchocerca volvulus TaxID=6282 RepID=A0A8R1XZ51_ONCVO
MAFAPLAKRLKEICDVNGILTTGDWEIVHRILENETFLSALQADGHLFGFDHNQFLKKLGDCAVREMEQNHTATTVKKFNGRAFEAFKIALWYFVKKIHTVDIVTVMDYLLKLLRYTFSRRQQVMDNMFAILHRNFAADITALLALLLEKKSILILRPYLCYGLWTNCMEFCLRYIDMCDYNCTLRTCSWILLRVARVAKYCGLMLLVEQMTGKIAEMLRKYLLTLHTSNKTFMLSDDLYVNLLRIFNELLFEFGAKNWHLMSTQSEELSDLIGRAWVDTVSLWQSRKFTDELISSLNEQSKFIEVVFIMHHPDCIPGSPLLSNSLTALLNLILDSVVNCMNGLSILHKSTYRIGQVQLLPNEVVSLLARLLTLDILQSTGNSHFDDLLFTEKDERWCQLIEKLFVRWSHRLPLQMKKGLFLNFVQLLISVHREGLLIWYLRAVTSIAESSVIELLEKEHCRYLWKFTLSVLQSQSQSVSEYAVRLLHKIIIPCAKRLELKDTYVTEVIWSNINRLNICTTEVTFLLAHVLSNFEFDEHFEIQPIDETAVKEWSFRCAALKFILKASLRPANIPVNAVLEILCFKPDFQLESPKSDISKLERYLMSLCAAPISEISCRIVAKKYFIRELVDFVGNNLMELWRSLKLESTDSEILQRDQINLFFTVQNLFSYFYTFCAECGPLLSVLQVMSLDLPRIIRSDKLTGVDEWLFTLGIEGCWQAADKELKNTICLKLKEMTLQQLIDHKNRFADKKDWNKELSNRTETASEIVLNYVNEAVRCCSSFREAVFIVEPFIQHGTMTERRKFITMLRTFAMTVMLEAEENKSERNVDELIIAELILTYLPVEEWKLYGVLFDNLTILHKSLNCSVWLDQAGLAKFVMNAELPDEFRAIVVKKIYMPPLKHKIHLRILAFLISMGTSRLYKQLKRIFPTFDAVIDLFLEAATVCYAVQPVLNDGFLPTDELKRVEVIQKISSNKQLFQRYLNAEEIITSHIMYLDVLFLVQEKMLSELFDRSDFKKSFVAAITMNLCCFFVKLRKLLRCCQFLGYEFLTFRALKNFLKCDLSACNISMKLFIIENCATLCALAARSCLASACTENITYLLDSWFDLYDLLLELHHDLAVEKAYCVFDVFLENSYCREEIMTRINMKNFEKSYFRIEYLFKILQVWSKYPTLRKFIAPCLTRFDSSHTGSYHYVFPVDVKLEELIALSLRELFFNPFELYPCEVYLYVCQILSSSTFILYVNNSFSDGSGQYEIVEDDSGMLQKIDDNAETFVLYYFERFIGLLHLSYANSLFKIAKYVPSFAFALLPHLFARIYGEGHDMSKFCVDVNYLLANFPERLIRNDYPLVVVIVACIRQARVNLASELGFRRLPFDLSKLSKVCLEINMTDDADYFLHCYLDRLSDPMRPVMHTLNGNRGFFDMFDGKESTDKPAELFMEILTKMDDADSLRPLSLQIKDYSRCHMILAKNQCDWSHLAAFKHTTDLKNLRSVAFYYAGLDVPSEFHEMANLACAELQQWDRSFLKIYSKENTGRQIYSILFTRLKKESELSQLLCDLAMKIKCDEIAKSWVIPRDLLHDLSHCCEVNDLVQRNAPPRRGSILSCPWIVCKYGNERVPARILTPMIIARTEYLCKKNAYERALQIIEKYRKFVDIDENVYREYDITKARILKKCGYEEAARLLLSQIFSAKSGSDNFLELSLRARILLAEFDMEACRPDLAIDALKMAVEKTLSTGHENVLLLAEVHKRLAIYAEKKLLLLEDYCSSETFKVKKTAIKKWEEELRAIREERLQAVRQGKMVEQGKLLEEKRIQKEKMSEEKELVQYCNDRNMLILTALDAYLAALELDASAADIPYRILPFFLRLNRFQSRPWIPLISHLCSHFFDDAPLAVIVREDRLRRIEDLLWDASTKDKSLRNPIEIMRKAFSLYAQFAITSVRTFQNKKYARSTASIADSVLLNEAENLRNVPIPAIEQPAIDIVFQLTDDSSQLITFINIEPVVTIADGITQPTIVTVIGSDGKVRKLIFKNEDLRQDSLVEQLFTVVNILLMNEDKTFPLRTYHVMPINSSAGIIEFCLGTVSLCNYICGADRKSGMHKKLYPLEMTAAAARFKLSEARTNQSNLVETYEEICKGIHPVFRHFFYDSFPDPLEWFSRIKDYTISLARWSIVGYIVGLGDRHLNNIMIEKETGRLLHIDLGMVFEFGKRNLLIPERVPFRLTREMIDPILIEGVNGKFKNVAVDTLDRLRKNSQVLIGLALVLLNDPLMKYLGGEKGSHSATLAICRLRDKLAGIENRIYMDPSQQVSHLIKEASNPENLARMFAGWMPFL